MTAWFQSWGMSYEWAWFIATIVGILGVVGAWEVIIPEPRAEHVRPLAQLRLAIIEALHAARAPATAELPVAEPLNFEI